MTTTTKPDTAVPTTLEVDSYDVTAAKGSVTQGISQIPSVPTATNTGTVGSGVRRDDDCLHRSVDDSSQNQAGTRNEGFTNVGSALKVASTPAAIGIVTDKLKRKKLPTQANREAATTTQTSMGEVALPTTPANVAVNSAVTSDIQQSTGLPTINNVVMLSKQGTISNEEIMDSNCFETSDDNNSQKQVVTVEVASTKVYSTGNDTPITSDINYP